MVGKRTTTEYSTEMSTIIMAKLYPLYPCQLCWGKSVEKEVILERGEGRRWDGRTGEMRRGKRLERKGEERRDNETVGKRRSKGAQHHTDKQYTHRQHICGTWHTQTYTYTHLSRVVLVRWCSLSSQFSIFTS